MVESGMSITGGTIVAIGVWLRRWIRPLINRFRTSSDLMTLVIGGDFNETGLGLVCMLVSSSVSEVWLALVSTGI